MLNRNTFLKINNLSKRYSNSTGFRFASKSSHSVLKNISLAIYEGECLGIVGESGSGKTTLGKCLLRLTTTDYGSVIHEGQDLLQISAKKFRRLRPKFQMIFQNHTQALNPRLRVGACLKEPLKIYGSHRKDSLTGRVAELLTTVNLDPAIAERYPNELSGGQRQRVAIARALSTNPRFLIADEPTSSLDAAIKRNLVELLSALQKRLGLTLLLISHDLTVVSNICDRIAVMYGGVIVELASAKSLIMAPFHPYSKLLLQSARMELAGDISKSTFDEPCEVRANAKGCVYAHRCPWAESICVAENPLLRKMSGDREVRCHFAEKINSSQQSAVSSQP